MVLERLLTAEENRRTVRELREASSNNGGCSTSSSATSNNNSNNKESKDKKNRKKEELNLKEEEGVVTCLPPSARSRGRGRDRRVRPTRAEKVFLPKGSFRDGVGSKFASKLYYANDEEGIGAQWWEGRKEKASFWSPGTALNGKNANLNSGSHRGRYANVGLSEEGKKGCEWENGNEIRRKSEASLNAEDGDGNGTLVGRSFSWKEEFMGKRTKGIMKNESFVVPPQIRIRESSGEAGDVACRVVGNMKESWIHLEDRKNANERRPCTCCSIGEIKKLGKTISQGHKNYQLMLSLQWGIRFSVGKANSKELNPEDFDPKEKFWTRFPPQGSKITPAHQLGEFRWKDYCPMVFRHLRRIFEIDSADYMLAICENGSLRELSSPGKSGSFFYMTQDDRFMIKTVKKSEVKVLIKMLPSYYRHVYQYKNSLITKFFGVHCIKPAGGQKTRFIIMSNLFGSDYRIHRRFDLKGSSHGRMTSKPEDGIDETTTLKDLDLNFIFHLHKYWFQKLTRQIDRDCKFLESERIMDYSLLVGLHFLDNSSNKSSLSPYTVHSGDTKLCQNKGLCRCHLFEMDIRDRNMILSGRRKLIRLGRNMPARAEYMARSNLDQFGPSEGGKAAPSGGEIYRVILHFGIIDILQDYDINKKLEHAYKSLQVDPTSISAVDPKLYSNRFQGFVRKIFVEDK